MSKSDKVIEGLTQNQALFVSEYLKTGNATTSYLKAYPRVKSKDVAGSAAARLLANVRISRAIAERQKQRNERLQLEEDFELKTAMRLMEMCMEPKQVCDLKGNPVMDDDGHYVLSFDSKGANVALQTICRLRGKFTEKKQVDFNISARSERLLDALGKLNALDEESRSPAEEDEE